jgi:PTS system fructose-specific IIC component
MKISDILTEDLVVTHLEGKSKRDVIDAMVDIVARSPKVLDAVADIVAAFAVTAEPIDYESLDEKPVRLVFLLVGKDNLVGPHIKLLSRISRLMNKEEFRNRLLLVPTSREVLELFRQEEASYFEV